MKNYVDIEKFKTIDELLDHAEWRHGPGTFVTIGRFRKRNIAAFDQNVAEHGERVRWPGEKKKLLPQKNCASGRIPAGGD